MPVKRSGAVPAFRTVVVSARLWPTLTLPNRRLVGLTTAAGVPAAAAVVAEAAADRPDSLLAASTARTWYECEDPDGSPVSEKLVPTTSAPNCVGTPSLYTR